MLLGKMYFLVENESVFTGGNSGSSIHAPRSAEVSPPPPPPLEPSPNSELPPPPQSDPHRFPNPPPRVSITPASGGSVAAAGLPPPSPHSPYGGAAALSPHAPVSPGVSVMSAGSWFSEGSGMNAELAGAQAEVILWLSLAHTHGAWFSGRYASLTKLQYLCFMC